MTMLSAILLASLAQASEPAPAVPPAPAPLAAAEAVTLFQSYCIGTMPDPLAFSRALSSGGIAWTAYENPRREPGVGGNYWRAAQGQLGYLYRRTEDGAGPHPFCEIVFLTPPGFNREAAAGALATMLSLESGRREGETIRWERRLPNGTEVRIAFAPSEDLGGPAARLSVFAYRLPPGFE